jgi:hypothetical protein
LIELADERSTHASRSLRRSAARSAGASPFWIFTQPLDDLGGVPTVTSRMFRERRDHTGEVVGTVAMTAVELGGGAVVLIAADVVGEGCAGVGSSRTLPMREPEGIGRSRPTVRTTRARDDSCQLPRGRLSAAVAT